MEICPIASSTHEPYSLIGDWLIDSGCTIARHYLVIIVHVMKVAEVVVDGTMGPQYDGTTTY
jgi:hypothetical protein